MSDTMANRGEMLVSEIDQHNKEIEFAVYLANRTMDDELSALLAGEYSETDMPGEPSKTALTAAIAQNQHKPLPKTEKAQPRSFEVKWCECGPCGAIARYYLLVLNKAICPFHWEALPESLKTQGYEDWHGTPIPADYYGNPDNHPYEDESDYTDTMPDTMREQGDPDA